MEQALRIRDAFRRKGCSFLIESRTNQQFPILNQEQMQKLAANYAYSVWEPVDAGHTAVRFCTSWATTDAQVDQLIRDIEQL